VRTRQRHDAVAGQLACAEKTEQFRLLAAHDVRRAIARAATGQPRHDVHHASSDRCLMQVCRQAVQSDRAFDIARIGPAHVRTHHAARIYPVRIGPAPQQALNLRDHARTIERGDARRLGEGIADVTGMVEKVSPEI